MKHTRFFLMLAMLALAGIAKAANNKLVVQDMSLEPGSSVTLDVALENETTNLMGFQCDIVLPEGLTLKLKNNGKPSASLGDRFEDTEHSISSSVTSSGAYRFIATSLDGEAIPGTNGTLFTVTLKGDASLSPSTTLECQVKNIEFNTQDNQKVVFDDVTFNVNIPGEAEASEVTANSYTREYGEANPTFEFTVEGEDLVGIPEITCNATPDSPVGTYDIVISQGTVTNSNVTYINGTLTITKAPLTIKAGDYTKKQGEAMPDFVPTFEGFKNDETSDVLTELPTVSCEATADSEPGEYEITVSSAEAQNYDISYVDGTLTVTSNTIVPDPVNKLVVQDMSLEPGSSVTLDVALENETTNLMGFQCDIVLPEGLTLKLKNNGKPSASLGDRFEDTEHSISSSVTSSGAYRFIATSLDGEAIPGTNGTLFTVTLKGDASLSPSTTLECQVKNIEFNTQDNQKVVFDDVTFNVNIPGEAEASEVTANSYTREYGEANPTFEFTVEGEDLVGIPEITCNATPDSPVGTYDIVISQGTVTNSNVTYINGTLTITKAPLTIKAGDYTKKQGEAMPDFVPTFEGFKNDETSEVLTKQPTVSCEADANSMTGEYDVTVAGAEAQNYEISYVNGVLTITEAESVTVTANSYTREYGDANPTFEFTVEGAVLNGAPEIICEATEISPVGEYPIIIKKGGVTNYNDTYVNGTLTITKAPLTIKAGNYTKMQGEQNPEFTLTYEGFKNNETSEVLTKQPTVSCEATADCALGDYDVTVSDAEAQNYDISYVNGKLMVTEAEIVQNFEVDGISYYVTKLPEGESSGEVEVVQKEEGYEDDIVIPAEIIFGDKTYKVTGIGEKAFYDCSYLSSVVIPNSVTSIGEQAFYGAGLTSITIPNSVKTIGGSAFENCIDLGSAKIGNGVSSIEGGVFANCESLTSVKIGKNVRTIEDEAFNGCASLTSITLPNMLESIGNSAFANSGLASITIPDNVTRIGEGAFENSSLTTAILGEGITEIEQQTFSGCTSLTSINIPDEVTTIGNNAFSGCGLTAITIPDNVEEIGEYAFSGNSSLTTVMLGDGISEIAEGTFNACSSLTSIIIPDWVTNIGNQAFKDCNALTSVKLSESLISLGENVFPSTMKSIELPNSFTVIPDNLFSNNYFQYIKLGNSVKSIGKNAFGSSEPVIEISTSTPPKIASNAFPNVEYLADLTVIVPNATAETAYRKVAVWQDMTFANQNNSAEVTVDTPGDLSWELLDECGMQAAKVVDLKVNGTINAADFTQMLVNMKSLLRLDLSDCNITEIPDDALNGKTQLQELTLPAGLQTIGKSAFQGCIYLTGQLDLPSTVTSIGESAFVGTDYTSVKLPSTLKTIGDYAFQGLPIKQKLTLPNRVTSVGASAFEGTLITGLTIYDGLTSIGDYAFAGTPIQGHVTIPDGVTSLGKGAFKNTQISTVFLPNSVPTLSEGLFQGCPNLNTVYVPDNYTAFDGSAFDGCGSLTILRLSANLTTMGEYSFQNTPLEYIKVPSKVEVLSKGVLKNCKNLASVSLPANLKTVEAEAFTGCTALRNLSVEATTPPVIKNRSAIRGINTDLCLISIPTQSYRNYVLAEYWGQFVQMRNDIAVETAGNGEIAFESVEEEEEEEELETKARGLRSAAARARRRVSALATEEESMTYANNGSSVYVPQQGKVRFHILPAAGEELLSATLDGEDIMPFIEDGVYIATADKKNGKLVVKFSGAGQGDVALAGDVNGDGLIDIADAIGIVNHILNKPSTTFVEAAADVNNDNRIDIADAIAVVNIILGKNVVTQAQIRQLVLDPQ